MLGEGAAQKRAGWCARGSCARRSLRRWDLAIEIHLSNRPNAGQYKPFLDSCHMTGSENGHCVMKMRNLPRDRQGQDAWTQAKAVAIMIAQYADRLTPLSASSSLTKRGSLLRALFLARR
eukprot:scaffold150_cov204-Pinguiococcus_pyrenoidosus.AAC.2